MIPFSLYILKILKGKKWVLLTRPGVVQANQTRTVPCIRPKGRRLGTSEGKTEGRQLILPIGLLLRGKSTFFISKSQLLKTR